MGSDRLKENSKSIILTLEETLEDQKDLSQLCTDRPLQTQEIYWLNAAYGLDWIVKEYAELPDDDPLKVVIPHGIYLTEDVVIDPDITADLPVILCQSLHEERGYTKQILKYGFNKLVLYSAFPFLYVIELLKDQPKPDRKGTIFFLPHSTPDMMVCMDFEALAEGLAHLDNEYQPITVCAYWSDLQRGYHLPFQDRGMKIVSAGHVYDPSFLFRFYHLCSLHHYSVSCSLGSHIFYSVKSGCSYFHLTGIKYSYKLDNLNSEKHLQQSIDKWHSVEEDSELVSLFSHPQPCMTAEQMKIVDYYLGTDYFKSPTELRYQLHQAEILYKMDLRPELHWNQYQLHETRGELQKSQDRCQQAQTELQQTQEQLQKIRDELQQTQLQLQQSQATIVGMESSKFWRLRNRWFQIKQVMGFKKEVN
jgi:hypothetical protein